MQKKELIDALEMIKDMCGDSGGLCLGCPLYNQAYDCTISNISPRLWDIKDITNRLFPTITCDEYVILNNLDEEFKGCYICRNSDRFNNILGLYDNKPIKDTRGFWSDDVCMDSSLHMFNDIFSSIKWEDEEPKKVRDLIKEYEEVHGICS